MTPKDFFDAYNKSAIISCMPYKLFPSVLLAQAALESAWGESSLTRDGNNFFGIKATSSWGNEVINAQTHEVYNGVDQVITDGFEAYKLPYYSFLDRNRILQLQRYIDAGVLSAATPEIQCQAIKDGGWATDPGYPGKLISIINQYGLKEYDKKKVICELVCSL